jgi:hypothetical protein
VFLDLFSTGRFWLVVLTAAALVFLRRSSYQSLRRLWHPSDLMILNERERLGLDKRSGGGDGEGGGAGGGGPREEEGEGEGEEGWQARQRLASLSADPRMG